ncbi:MAG: rRNA maturation RNase YbeY [Bdellovibrionales bacterium]|nr:rRNA maturation RNase YbeY [Bdellovibrionales bacterium]
MASRSATITPTSARRRLARWLRAARAEAALERRARGPAWAADLLLVSADRMLALNRRYRGKSSPTDVLSFPSPAPLRSVTGHLGELVVCLPVLRAQARAEGHPPARELDVLLVHGLLHLLGFDHERGPAAARAQARWEARLLATQPGAAERGPRGLVVRGRGGSGSKGRS